MRKLLTKKILFALSLIISVAATHAMSYANENATAGSNSKKQSEKVYKSVGPNGGVIFSDKPTPGSKEITVPTTGGYHPVPTPAFTPYQEPAPKSRAIQNSVSITHPKNEQTIENTTGEVNVSVRLGAGLRGGQHLEYVLDGKTVYTGSQTNYRFSNVFRGSHVIVVRIVQKSGSIESSPVTFYVHRPIHKPHPHKKKPKKSPPPSS